MNDEGGFITGFFIGVWLTILIASIIYNTSKKEWQKAAIEHKAARHNPVTGKFEWIKKEK